MSTRAILHACLTVSLISLALIGARITQEDVHATAAFTFPQARPQVVAAPSPYTLKWSSARAEPQRSKDRPPVLLGTVTPAGLTLYCAGALGPLTVAVRAGDAWSCRPFLGEPRPIAMSAACRFLYDNDDAFARQWRCYRDAS